MLFSEIAFTRIVSYVLLYPFAYFLIGLALLGIGLGAASISLSRNLQFDDAFAARHFAAFAGGVVLSVIGLAFLPLDMDRWYQTPGQIICWLALAVALITPFHFAGRLLAAAFRSGGDAPGTLYAIDLASAALASASIVPLLSLIGPLRALLIPVGLSVVLTFWLAGERRRVATLALLPLVLLSLLAVGDETSIQTSSRKHLRMLAPDHEILYSRWHSLLRVDVSKGGPRDSAVERRFIWHDANVGSSFTLVPSQEAGAAEWDGTFKQVPHLITEAPNVLVIGAAGGVDLAVALHYGARHATGVEINPVTYGLIHGEFADFTGRLVYRPDVDYVLSEGRRFAELHPNEFDLIQLVSPDSYAAQPGAAQVLVESNLYTREAFIAYWNALTERGVLALEIGNLPWGPKLNTIRMVGQARDLLERQGVADPARHMAVVHQPRFSISLSSAVLAMTQVMISKVPFSDEVIATLEQAEAGGGLEFALVPGAPDRETPIGYLAAGGVPDLSRFDLGHLNVTPVTDDSPYFFSHYRFAALLRGQGQFGVGREYTGSQLLLLGLLALSAVALAAALLLPRALAPRRQQRGVLRMGLAIALLGWAFMAIEINTIQRLTLYLGYPTYALTVVLTGLLIGTGGGSLWRESVSIPRALAVGTFAVLATTGVAIALLPAVTAATFQSSVSVRISIALAFTLLQGVGLGVFFPSALELLGRRGPRWVAWGWTINGVASVLGSSAAVIAAMTLGFRLSALLAGLAYIVIALLLWQASKAELPQKTV